MNDGDSGEHIRLHFKGFIFGNFTKNIFCLNPDILVCSIKVINAYDL